MSVKRTAILTGLSRNTTEQMIRDRCNEHGLNCVSVSITHDVRTGRPSAYAKVVFVNSEKTDKTLFTHLTSIDEWDVTDMQIVPNGLGYARRPDPSPSNPVKFLHDVVALDLPSHPRFGEVMANGGMTLTAAPGGGISVSRRIQDKERSGEEKEKKKKNSETKTAALVAPKKIIDKKKKKHKKVSRKQKE